MAFELIKYWAVLIILLFSSLSNWVSGEPQVPCYFVFGDSLVDHGNNNALLTLAKANYPPNGIDFPRGSTGRFSNGQTSADITAELLGFDEYIPAFATANGEEILKGVNYASAAAGIRRESGQELGRFGPVTLDRANLLARPDHLEIEWPTGARFCLDDQLRHHETIISSITNLLGNKDTTTKYLSKCLYSMALGSNDYLNNYFLPILYPTSLQYTSEQYADVLI
ncbi:unnamed protein product [Ilex paraguariensis]|uniref:GDSL esterase/lipase n=1 Tax=Ilex paraguariensis TaxID=185542 RepID=A0ABC8RX19_9AQUA